MRLKNKHPLFSGIAWHSKNTYMWRFRSLHPLPPYPHPRAHTHPHTYIHTYTHERACTHTHRERERERARERERERERERDGGREVERETHRERQRERDRERQREKKKRKKNGAVTTFQDRISDRTKHFIKFLLEEEDTMPQLIFTDPCFANTWTVS